MAVNYSHRPVLPALISEDNFISPMRNVSGEGCSRPWHSSGGEIEERNYNYGRDVIDCSSSQESTSKDILDLLPTDPFGMDIKTTFTAITGWLEDLEVGYGGYVRSQEDYALFAGWNFIWNNSLNLQPFYSNDQFYEKFDTGFWSFPNELPVLDKPHEKSNVANGVNHIREKLEGSSNFDGVPHEALAYTLRYLGVKDLLSVERVCKSLRSTVQEDPLLWRSIHIDQPLNERITDDILVRLACRAQANLQCLNLVECPRITDDGLTRIFDANPRLTKLCVPGCTRLSIEGVVNNIKRYNSNKDGGGVKNLRIGGFFGVTHEHFGELKLLLSGGNSNHYFKNGHKQHFYHRGNFYLPFEDNRAIDIEMCPKCEKVRLVYDCPAEGCKGKDKTGQECRACTLCIARCAQCGRCINDTEYEETFCLELLCSECFNVVGVGCGV